MNAAETLIEELLVAYNTKGRGTWYLWRYRDKRKEILELLEQAMVRPKQPSPHGGDL